MSNRSSIHYKFKTENVNKVVTFDGNQILADELKRLIAKDEGINLELFELSLTDDSTNKSYDEGFVPKNVVVVVRRLPKENVVKMPKVNNTEGSGVVPAKTTLQIAPVHINEEIFSKMSEEERLAHINQVSAIKYDPRSYGKPSMIGKASPSYQCSKCSGFGHFPKQCPLAHIRRATGIPADELMETTPDNPNAYLHVSGKYVVPKIHEQAREQRKIVDKLTAQRLQGNFPLLSTKMEKIDIPEEFKCPICKELMKDAVLVPCCGESFCLDCIENVMLQTSLTEEGSRCLCSTILRANSLYDNKSLRRAITKFQKEHLSKVNLKNVDGSLSLAAKPVPITDNMDFSENLPPLHRPNESPEKLLDDYVRVVNPFDTVMPAVSTVIMDSNRSPLTETTVSVNVQTAISFSSTQPIIPLIGKAEDFTNDSSNEISSLSPLTIPSPLHSVGFPLFDQTMMSSMPMIPQQSLPLISSEQMQISSQIIPTLPTSMSSTMPTKTMTSSKIDMDDDKKAAFEEAKAKIWDEMVISESLEIADWFPESNLKKRKRDENEPERCEKRRREEKSGKCEHERHRKDEDKPKRDRERYDGRGKETEKVEEWKKEGDERLRREKNEVDRHKRHGSKEKDEKRRREERKEKIESEKHGKDRKKSERREKDKKREKKEKKREKKEKREKEKKKDHRERDRSRSR